MIEKEHGVWRQSLVGKTPTEEQMHVMTEEQYVDYDVEYPREPVAVGHQWEMKDPIYLAKLIGPALAVDGKITFTFRDILKFRNERCALISWRFELVADILEVGEKLRIEFSADGETYRSLERYLDVQSTGRGLLQVQGPFRDGDERGWLSVGGPMVFSIAEELVEN